MKKSVAKVGGWGILPLSARNTPDTEPMKTLEIKKTATGQFKYRIVDSFSGETVPPQYGSHEAESTIEAARSRFSFDTVMDVTECTVEVLGRDGKTAAVTMTKACFDKSSTAPRSGHSADQFMGRIIAMAGVEVR
jgi:hypothetical protein